MYKLVHLLLTWKTTQVYMSISISEEKWWYKTICRWWNCSFLFHLNTSCQMRVLSRLSTMSEQHTSLKFDLCLKPCQCRYAHRSWLKVSTCHQMPTRWTHPKRKIRLIYQNLNPLFLLLINASGLILHWRKKQFASKGVDEEHKVN